MPTDPATTPKLTDGQKIAANLLVVLLPHYLAKYHRTGEALAAARIDVETILAEVRQNF